MPVTTTIDESTGFRGIGNPQPILTALQEYTEAVNNMEFGATSSEIYNYMVGWAPSGTLRNAFSAVDTLMDELVNNTLTELKTQLESLRSDYAANARAQESNITTATRQIRS